VQESCSRTIIERSIPLPVGRLKFKTVSSSTLSGKEAVHKESPAVSLWLCRPCASGICFLSKKPEAGVAEAADGMHIAPKSPSALQAPRVENRSRHSDQRPSGWCGGERGGVATRADSSRHGQALEYFRGVDAGRQARVIYRSWGRRRWFMFWLGT